MRYRGKGGGRGGGGSDQIRYLYPTGGFEGRERKRKGGKFGWSLSVALKKKGESFVVKFLNMYNHERTNFVQFQCERKGWNVM